MHCGTMAASSRVLFASQPRYVDHRWTSPTGFVQRARAMHRRPIEPFYVKESSCGDVICQAVKSAEAGEQLDEAAMQLISELSSSADSYVKDLAQQHLDATKQESTLLPESTELRNKVMKSILDLQSGLLERETEVRLLLLAALCGEHLLLLGPPGTAKSELSRRLSSLCGGRYFERLLTRFSVPEELFGPLSMKGLENDLYIRQIDGYLPTAEVAFIDEIFKANSAILNALLTLLNERLFDNGNERLPVPLLCLVGASNELPESEELDALYDRFLIRRQVSQVTSGQLPKLARLAAGREGFADASLSSDSGDAFDLDDVQDLSLEDFKSVASLAYQAVDVPETVIDILTSLRDYLQDKCEPPIYVSDRRFMKAVQTLQVAAHADGRTEVNEYDCLLLEHVFGNRPDDAQKVKSYVIETIASDPGLQQSTLVFLGLFGRACRILESASYDELPETRGELMSLVDLLKSRHQGLTSNLEGQFPELRRTVWQSEATVQAAIQALTPQMTENKKKVIDLLKEIVTVGDCLEKRVSSGTLEKLLPKRYKQYKKGISGQT